MRETGTGQQVAQFHERLMMMIMMMFTVGCFWYHSEPDESIPHPPNPVLLKTIFFYPILPPLHLCLLITFSRQNF